MRSFKYSERLQYFTWTWIAYDVLKLTCVEKYYIAWSILSLHVFKRSLYPPTWGNLFKLAKLPIVSERGKNVFSYHIPYK